MPDPANSNVPASGQETRQPRPARPEDGLAWVTGASTGIGRAVALELARRGWTVVATARKADELASLAAESGGRVIPRAGDITDRAGMAALVASIEAEHGPIARGLLNAGTYIGEAEKNFSADAIKRTFDINVGGTVNCLEPVLAAMGMRRRGQIAITASVAGYGPLPRSLGYGPTKAALINLAGSLRMTYRSSGILVQVVCPGFVKTPLTAKNTFPMPFLVEVDDAAKVICDGLDREKFEIAFPWQFVAILKALNHLPWRAYFPLVAFRTGQ